MSPDIDDNHTLQSKFDKNTIPFYFVQQLPGKSYFCIDIFERTFNKVKYKTFLTIKVKETRQTLSDKRIHLMQIASIFIFVNFMKQVIKPVNYRAKLD